MSLQDSSRNDKSGTPRRRRTQCLVNAHGASDCHDLVWHEWAEACFLAFKCPDCFSTSSAHQSDCSDIESTAQSAGCQQKSEGLDVWTCQSSCPDCWQADLNTSWCPSRDEGISCNVKSFVSTTWDDIGCKRASCHWKKKNIYIYRAHLGLEKETAINLRIFRAVLSKKLSNLQILGFFEVHGPKNRPWCHSKHLSIMPIKDAQSAHPSPDAPLLGHERWTPSRCGGADHRRGLRGLDGRTGVECLRCP